VIPDDPLEGEDVIFHLPGFTHGLRFEKKVAEFYQKINVDATLHLTNLAVKSRGKKCVFVSSVKASGASALASTRERDPDDLEEIYGKTKPEAELKLLKIGNYSTRWITHI